MGRRVFLVVNLPVFVGDILSYVTHCSHFAHFTTDSLLKSFKNNNSVLKHIKTNNSILKPILLVISPIYTFAFCPHYHRFEEMPSHLQIASFVLIRIVIFAS